jgi:hypothetical protein
MHIEDRLTAIEEKLDSILEALYKTVSSEIETDPEPEPAPAAKRGRPAAKAAAEPAPTPAAKGKKAKPAPSVTIDDLRAECVKLAKADDEGKEKIVAALQRHGAERLGELPEDRYPDFLAMLKKISDEGFDPRDGSGGDEEDEDF